MWDYSAANYTLATTTTFKQSTDVIIPAPGQAIAPPVTPTQIAQVVDRSQSPVIINVPPPQNQGQKGKNRPPIIINVPPPQTPNQPDSQPETISQVDEDNSPAKIKFPTFQLPNFPPNPKSQLPNFPPNPAVSQPADHSPVIIKLPNPPTPQPNNSTLVKDLVVTATDVQIYGADPELEQIIRKAIKTQTGGATSQSQLQTDVAAILNTGLFTSATVNSSVNPNGLNVVYQVRPVVVRAIQLSGANVLTYGVALEYLQPQVGRAISPAGLVQAVKQINQWYTDNGYTIARVLSIRPDRKGILTLNLAEGVVGNIQFRFINDQGENVDSKGKPVRGRTKTNFLRKQLKLQPGQVYQEDLAKQDVQQLSHLGLFQTVNVTMAQNATKLDLIYELQEISPRSINLGGNYNADHGLELTIGYKDQNFRGVNDTITGTVGVSTSGIEFNTKFISPYRATDPDRLGYTINFFRSRKLSDTFDDKILLANGDQAREEKFGGGFSFQRPIEGWDTSLGINYTRTSIVDSHGHITPTDSEGNPLSWSGTGVDDLTTISFSATQDHRNHPGSTTQGSLVKLSTDQSIPIGEGHISMNRLLGNYSQFVPVKFFSSQKPQVFALNLQAGTVIGDLPPYDTFNLGGINTVRGYGAGDLASARSYVLASTEYRFPVAPIAGGVVFADFASDLGSSDTVLGDPGGVRGKPGSGFGYGIGVRVESPIGLIRVDYGINDQGEGQAYIGLGQRF
jgi:outer membrane protein insertion porin family